MPRATDEPETRPETLMESLARSIPQVGRLEWIGLSPERRAALIEPQQAEAREGTGLEGEHHARSGRSKRQVTLIQAEHLEVVGALLGREPIPPGVVRRNLVVRGINLQGLRDRRFRIGEVLLEGTGPCPPCSRMQENLGEGGYHAMRGHGGITARVLEGGVLRIADPVRAEAAPTRPAG